MSISMSEGWLGRKSLAQDSSIALGITRWMDKMRGKGPHCRHPRPALHVPVVGSLTCKESLDTCE